MTDRTCAADGCERPVPTRTTPGRPSIYCSPACRPSAKRAGRTVTVEIDHPDHSPDGRPAQRVWTLRLRRGTHTIADNLGWPTASALAGQLQQLLHPTPPERGAPR
jgi:hypothetical protein